MLPLVLISKLILLSSTLPLSKDSYYTSMSSMIHQATHLDYPPDQDAHQYLFSNIFLFFQVFWLHLCCYPSWWRRRTCQIIRIHDNLPWSTHDSWNYRRIKTNHKQKIGVPKQKIQKYGVGPTHQSRPWWKILVILISIQCLDSCPSHQLPHQCCDHNYMV